MSDVRFLMAHGSRHTLIDTPDQTYPGISWPEIVRLCKEPQAKDKEASDFFIPSTYRDYDGRSHQAQRERGAFRMLAIDIDQGNLSKEDVIQAVREVLGDVSMLVYSSSGASEDNRKWRVLLPLATPIIGEEYEEAQSAFFHLLKQRGITPDGALARCGQPIYLPNVPISKRWPNLSPMFYDFEIVRGSNVFLTDASPIMQEVERRQEERRLALEHANQERLERERQRVDRCKLHPEDVNPVDAFNDAHTIEDLLLKYGYRRHGSSAHYRSRHQSSASFATQNFGTHWVSLSGSDAAAGIGRSKSMGENSYCFGDAFDLFVHYEHGGDFTAAVRAFGLEAGLSRRVASALLPDADNGSVVGVRHPNIEEIIQDEKGRPIFCHQTVYAILVTYPDWDGIFAYNEFSGLIMLLKPVPGARIPKSSFKPRAIKDSDFTHAVRWFNAHGFPKANQTTVTASVIAAANENILSPVRHYLEELSWDCIPRVGGWLIKYCGATDTAFNRAVGEKWLISAVARAFDPGCKVDTALIFEGTQGAGKSETFRTLASEEWFHDGLGDLGNKDASAGLKGKWIIELPELAAVRRTDVESVKAFLSRTHEKYRPPYGNVEVIEPRRCVFAGTTNRQDWLADDTGGRRFWPVEVKNINLKDLASDRNQIWAEAVEMYRTKQKWWLDPDEERMGATLVIQRTTDEPWTADVLKYAEKRSEVSTKEILLALSIELTRQTKADSMRVSGILTRAGWKRDGQFSKGDYKGLTRFVLPTRDGGGSTK